MMRIVFLDIDGVLNSERFWWTSGGTLPMGTVGAIDPVAVARLNRIVDATGALVVISSSWRTQGQERVDACLRSRGFMGAILGCTPIKLGCPRCAEIGEWLALHYGRTGEAPQSVILDDDGDAWHEDLDARFTRHVRTDWRVGLTDADAEAAIAWLVAS